MRDVLLAACLSICARTALGECAHDGADGCVAAVTEVVAILREEGFSYAADAGCATCWTG